MTKQPEALRLADLLDLGGDATRPNHWEAAAELRRLYGVNQELLEALKVLVANGGIGSEDMFDDARAAIAKAEVTK
jgi:dihydropteroate synthase